MSQINCLIVSDTSF